MELKRTEVFEENAQRYDDWYDKRRPVYESELRAIRMQLQKLPTNISGIEVGMGTGRFAEALGIKEGIEPADNLRQMAINRGIEGMEARAELLPYSDLQFDFVLFVTICYLEDPVQAFKEASRVLKNSGSIIVGIIDRDRPIGQDYVDRKSHSLFYKHARFYSVDRTRDMLEEAGFRNFEFTQTLFGKLDEIQEPQDPEEGFGKGGFVVIKATKKG
jgi:ubiquinone/menaquinone biosynthesis C-methylase UbiE